MTIASGMRPRRLRIPTALADGGTGARTREEAVAVLGVPSLGGNNTFTGLNTFGTVWANSIGRDGNDLTIVTLDTVTIDGAQGNAVLDTSTMTGTRVLAFPDADGTLALTGDPLQVPYNAQGLVYTASSTDCVINCTGTWTLTLPTAVGVSGRFYYIKNSGVGVITMAGTGGQTFDGVASPTVAAGASLTVCSDGANWLIL